MKTGGAFVFAVLFFLALTPTLFNTACDGGDPSTSSGQADDDYVPDDDADDDGDDDDTGQTTTTTVVTTTSTTTTVPPNICYRDADMDGYGDPDFSDEFEGINCPLRWVHDNTDCDDTSILVHPGAPELPDDGIDQDCDGDDLLLSDATGVFVALTGNDSSFGTMAAPKRTINAGVARATLAGKPVFVASGDYTEDVETEVSLFGGYESVDWTRDIDGYVTTINARTYAAAVEVVGSNQWWWDDDWDEDDWGEAKAYDSNPVAIQGFTINGGSGSNYSYGVHDRATATLVNNTINGGSGADLSYGVYNDCEEYERDERCGTATLVNNTIDGGSGGDSYGVYNYDTATLANNTINGGSGDNYSYGVYNHSGTATLVNNTIDGGAGGLGSAGVGNHAGTATLVDNVIDGGSGGNYSYGVSNRGTATLVNNTIIGGSGDNYSVGVINDDGMTMLANNTINGGAATGENSRSIGVHNISRTVTLANNVIDGGSGSWSIGVNNYGTALVANNTINGGSGSETYGVYNDGGTALLANNTIDGGSGSESYGVYGWNDGDGAVTVTLVSNDIWGADMDCMIYYYDGYPGECEANTIAGVNACAWTGCAGASGNINADPLFVDPAGGDFHLQSGSPCIDAGIDPAPYIGPRLVDFDFEGDARPYGAGWDIGADEWTP